MTVNFAQLTTTDLMDHVKADTTATERELVLLDRLMGAIDEVEQLTQVIARMQQDAVYQSEEAT